MKYATVETKTTVTTTSKKSVRLSQHQITEAVRQLGLSVPKDASATLTRTTAAPGFDYDIVFEWQETETEEESS